MCVHAYIENQQSNNHGRKDVHARTIKLFVKEKEQKEGMVCSRYRSCSQELAHLIADLARASMGSMHFLRRGSL